MSTWIKLPIFVGRIDIDETSFIVDRHVEQIALVSPNDGLRAGIDRRTAQRVQH